MANYSFFGSYFDEISQDILKEKVLEICHLTLLDQVKVSTIEEIFQTEIEINEVAIHFKENEGAVLFFNSQLSKDWIETIGLTNWNFETQCITGQYNTQDSKGSIQVYKNGILIKNIEKTSDTVSFPYYTDEVSADKEKNKLEYWIDKISSNAMGTKVADLIRNPDYKSNPVTIFTFDNALSTLASMKSDTKETIKRFRTDKLTEFRRFVESRLSASAAFESNRDDKVIYQFLSTDYELNIYSNISNNEIGKHPEFNRIADVFLRGSSIEIVQEIEKLAQDNIQFDGMFDLLLYTGLYFDDNKIRGNALALAVLMTNGNFRTNFWKLWSKNLYAKKVFLPSFKESIDFPHSSYAFIYTNLIQQKFSVVNESKDFNPKSYTIDVNLNCIDVSFLKYFEELIIINQTGFAHYSITDFINLLSVNQSTIKSLAFNNCDITSLYEDHLKLPITTLDISDNPIQSIDNVTLKNIETLKIRKTAIQSISIKNIPQIKTIVLDDLEQLDKIHLTDIHLLKPEFYFEVSKKEGNKKYFNFKKEEFDPFLEIPSKPFWKIW